MEQFKNMSLGSTPSELFQDKNIQSSKRYQQSVLVDGPYRKLVDSTAGFSPLDAGILPAYLTNRANSTGKIFDSKIYLSKVLVGCQSLPILNARHNFDGPLSITDFSSDVVYITKEKIKSLPFSILYPNMKQLDFLTRLMNDPTIEFTSFHDSEKGKGKEAPFGLISGMPVPCATEGPQEKKATVQSILQAPFNQMPKPSSATVGWIGFGLFFIGLGSKLLTHCMKKRKEMKEDSFPCIEIDEDESSEPKA